MLRYVCQYNNQHVQRAAIGVSDRDVKKQINSMITKEAIESEVMAIRGDWHTPCLTAWMLLVHG